MGTDGVAVAAHKLVLAAACGYFRALFLGAGSRMREAADSPTTTVQLRHHESQHLAALVEALYTRSLRVGAPASRACWERCWGQRAVLHSWSAGQLPRPPPPHLTCLCGAVLPGMAVGSRQWQGVKVGGGGCPSALNT